MTDTMPGDDNVSGSVGDQTTAKNAGVISTQTTDFNPDKIGARGQVYPNIAQSLWSLVVPIDQINLDAANARKHGDKNMEAIRASLSRFGQRSPIVVQRKGMVVRAGNGRLTAAKSMGWTHIAAVIVDEESADAVAFAIADNRTAELAEWDNETLANLLNTMGEEDLKSTGFDNADLQALLSDLTPAFDPVGIEEQGRLDQKSQKVCPKCGHEWHE